MPAILLVLITLLLGYLIWVAVAWGLLTVLAAFNVVSGTSPWVLAIPLALTTALLRGGR